MTTQTKSQATFTPGPWQTKAERVGPDGPFLGGIEHTVTDEDGFFVADCGISLDNSAAANARLIASAPDLLAVAKDALESLRRLQDAEGAYRITNIAQLEAAIAKAIGASSAERRRCRMLLREGQQA